MGGLVHFPRNGARRRETEWNDLVETSPNVLRPTRTTSDLSLVTWIDVRWNDGDDDGDGNGGNAA